MDEVVTSSLVHQRAVHVLDSIKHSPGGTTFTVGLFIRERASHSAGGVSSPDVNMAAPKCMCTLQDECSVLLH